MLRMRNVISEVAVFAEMCDFPCSKQELLRMADEQEFPDDVLDVLEDLPNRSFTCESALVEAAQSAAEPGTCSR